MCNPFYLQQASLANCALLWFLGCCLALLVWLPGLQALLLVLEKKENGSSWLVFFQLDHHIAFGWPLASHQALNVGATQWHFHNLWVICGSLLFGLNIFKHGVSGVIWLGPFLVPPCNEILESWMVGKGSIDLASPKK